MLRSVSVISMRKQHNESVLDSPLLLTGRNELIDHNLSAVGKVTELCLPDSQSIRVSLCIAVFVAKNSKLRKMRV